MGKDAKDDMDVMDDMDAKDDMDERPMPAATRVIQVDTRLVYGVLGVVAVAAVAVLGLMLGRGAAATAVAPVAVDDTAGMLANAEATVGVPGLEQVGAPRAAPQIELNVPTTVDGQPMIKPVVRGRSPVPPDQAPIGPEEARIWFTDLAAADWQLRMGEVSPLGPVEHDVIIENIGTAPLVLVDAGGECGCTAFEIMERQVAPGTRTVLRVKYDPRVTNDAGKLIRKQIYVRSNDPLTPVAEFHITAQVLEQ